AQKEHGDADVVLDAVGGGAAEDVSEKPVAVSAHGDEVATLLPHPFNDFVGRLAVSQFRVGGDAGIGEFGPHLDQVSRVFGDFGTDRVRSKGSRGPTVGDM